MLSAVTVSMADNPVMFVVFVGDAGEALWFLQEADLDFEEHTVPGHDDHVLLGFFDEFDGHEAMIILNEHGFTVMDYGFFH